MKNKKLARGLAIASIGVTVLRTQSTEFLIAVASAVLGTKRACQCDYSMQEGNDGKDDRRSNNARHEVKRETFKPLSSFLLFYMANFFLLIA
jgi:hypothetical protein